MADYKEMYLSLFRATEKAVKILISAQRECEERYLSSSESEVKMLFTEEKPEEESVKE